MTDSVEPQRRSCAELKADWIQSRHGVEFHFAPIDGGLALCRRKISKRTAPADAKKRCQDCQRSFDLVAGFLATSAKEAKE